VDEPHPEIRIALGGIGQARIEDLVAKIAPRIVGETDGHLDGLDGFQHRRQR
jgi:hypothetical protein